MPENESELKRPPKPDPALAAAGPLVVSEANPRYFTVASRSATDGAAVYLTGSHINNNFHDGMGPGADCAEIPERFDFDAYLEFLKDHGLNFIRLWRWEHFRSQIATVHLCMSPQPWPRTGSGTASDGKPRFDLSKFDDAYFERLRDRVAAAGKMGIYVGVMLFDGHAIHLSPPPDNIEGHPFHARNNVNGIGITSIVDYQVLPLDTGIQALQEAYIRKVVDTVHDLPNVRYEVANESSGDTADSVALPDGTVIPTPPFGRGSGSSSVVAAPARATPWHVQWYARARPAPGTVHREDRAHTRAREACTRRPQTKEELPWRSGATRSATKAHRRTWTPAILTEQSPTLRRIESPRRTTFRFGSTAWPTTSRWRAR